MFNKACASCHTLYGHGGEIGPDLTGSGRDNLDYLLENIVDPERHGQRRLPDGRSSRCATAASSTAWSGPATTAPSPSRRQTEALVLDRDEIEGIEADHRSR